MFLSFVLDTIYDVVAYQLCCGNSVWWYIGSRVLLLIVKRAAQPKPKPIPKILPNLFDFTAEEQKAILEATPNLPSWINFPDLERAEWVNTILARIWRPFGRYMHRLFKEWLEGVIQRALGPKLGFRFERVDMGSIPIRLSGIKGYKENVDRGEILMDWEIYYNGDAEFIVTTLGVKSGLKNIQLRGTLRIVLKPVLADMPLIGGMEFYFLNPPTLDFEMTNLLSIPGIASLKHSIHNIVMDNLNWYLVLPNKYPISFTSDVSWKEVMFELPAGVLRVQLIAAKQLTALDMSLVGKPTSDPYVKLQLGARELRSKTIAKELNPIWDEIYDFIVQEPHGQLLNVTLYDDDVTEDDLLGSFSVDSGSVRISERVDEWYFLLGGGKGQVHLKMQWMELSSDKQDLMPTLLRNRTLSHLSELPLTTAVLLILIDSAENLPKVPVVNRDPNPLAIASLGQQSFKTRACKHTLTPVWEQQTTFYVHNPKTEHLTIVIKDELVDEPLGSIYIALDSILEADHMSLERPFELKNSGPHTTVRLKIVMRLVTSADIRNSYLKAGMQQLQARPTAPNSSSLPATNQNPLSDIYDRDGLALVQPINPFADEFWNTPRIHLAMQYKVKTNHVLVEVIEAHNLGVLWDAIGQAKRKVYVSLTMPPTKLRFMTKEAKDMETAVYKETFECLLQKTSVNSCILCAQVAWGNRFSFRVLAEAKVPLRTVRMSERIDLWYKLLEPFNAAVPVNATHAAPSVADVHERSKSK